VENIRAVAEVARLMVGRRPHRAGVLHLPFRAERRMARELMGPDEFVEVFVDAPLELAEARDPKGFTARRARGR
jgi:bifunctional enzyme CysN/CysC